jgi:putative porin
MKAVKIMFLMLSLGLGLLGQTQPTAPAKTKAKAHKASAAAATDDFSSLRDALNKQQQQMDEMRTEMQRKDQMLQQTIQQLQSLQNATADAQNKAAAAETASTQSNETVSKLQSDLADVKLNQTNAAASTQEDQKRVGNLEGLVNRFRFGGDVRVREDSIFQSYEGCPTGSCEDRNRARIRVRFGVEGKLNEDFSGGFYIATGTLSNGAPSFTTPVSANDTLTGFFEKKAIGLDRGWVTYNPTAHKWINLTGGKFAYTWQHTDYTFDPDLNPEGFSEKFSFDLAHAGMLKNVTFQGLQLLFNEVSAGRDAKAIGGQFLFKAKPVSIWTITPSFTLLDWSNVDSIAQAVSPIPICTTIGPTNCIPQQVTPAAGAILPVARTISASTLAGPLTNSTVILGKPGSTSRTRGFASRFTYADLIIDNNVTTPWKKWPVRVLGEYENNLRDSVNNRNELWAAQFEVGQQKEKHDWLFGYFFSRTDQDAVISSFAQDDQRTPTNGIQHKFYVNYLLAKNTTAVFTWWHGRTQDATLQNALHFGAPFSTATMQDPYQNRLQFDVVYKF